MQHRIEKDSMGSLQVPVDALYSAQTQRAIDNFNISDLTLPTEFIHSLVMIKKAVAITNYELSQLDEPLKDAIVKACDAILSGEHQDQFPVDLFQTGSGTSTNMNVNEVLATLATRLGGIEVSPNDHVNMGQSSNDTIPTSIHVSAAIATEKKLIPALEYLERAIENKANTLKDTVKTGRTHLMDAMPVTMAQELSGWQTQISKGISRVKNALNHLRELGLGGTAVGTGINAHPQLATKVSAKLKEFTNIDFRPNTNFFESLSTQDAAVELSGALKVLAVSLTKISNDLRWMNSGPFAGLGEIELKALQPGSSIMPGKVNPVIPEAVLMVCAQVIGNDATITIAGQAGNFQLNVMLPVIAYNLLQSIQIVSNAVVSLADSAITDFKVKNENIKKPLARNPIAVTSLNPVIGYLKAAKIAKRSYQEEKELIEVALEETELSKEELEKYFDPLKLTEGGI